MEYNFKQIEQQAQARWEKAQAYKANNHSDKKPYYVLDMFPYPSGAGLHVGHPLGYIASDIYARYKRLQGFNVLHPMGFDSYGLPAEQYAIQTGQHPEVTTMKNIDRYIEQLKKIGFCYDWDREVKTCDPEFYKWTQWAFIQMFNSYFDPVQQKARPIAELVKHFEQTDVTWNTLTKKQQQERLMNYRIAYLSDTKVNWCPKLGTVLANDEVSEGLSVRGGYPVEQRVMRQWSLRVSAYAGRLLEGLDRIDWTDSLKETQRNWIGRSEGAEMQFNIKGQEEPFTIFTTRADTVFGVTFMVLAPESEYVARVVIDAQKAEVEAYLDRCKHRTERERIADRKVTGVFTGSYAINPLTNAEIPIYISDYVLSGYGTGAIMAVPAHDSRDYAFAKHFNLPIIPLIEGADVSEQSFDAKEGKMINSGFLNGLEVKEAIAKMKEYITNTGIGRVKVNYRLRDAIFSRQRYWGEPFPVYYKDGMPYMIDEKDLPLMLPEVDNFKPTEDGRPPLGNAKDWTYKGYPLELNTMPGFAGSSAYYLRYMDNHNSEALVDKNVNAYWRQVNLYIGGTEHATGHLIYSRFWNKFLYDLGYICEDEPFQKLINQGMIQGRSNFVYRYIGEGATGNLYISYNLIDNPEYKGKVQPIHVNVNIVKNDILDIMAFRNWMPEYKDAQFVYADGTTDEDNPHIGTPSEKQYICGWAVEKMSKSMFNVVNPDDVVEQYGADTLRLYEMFLGPLEMSKPWDTNGIDGVHRFLKKLWSMYENPSDEQPSKDELKSLHKLIKKITWDIENFSFNTSIPAFMIAQNELATLKCNKKAILSQVAILLTPYAPHIAEAMWAQCGEQGFVIDAQWPVCNEEYLVEDNVKYPIQFNGKVKFTIELSKSATKDDVEKTVMEHAETQRLLNGATPKKVIVVPGRIVNIVV
ncbi:MAG: leucine--tRNA ligase [Paludibacteraceae bacterium]|nr:leucine--tRNA ligase [Paludibacteraceae bacterium]